MKLLASSIGTSLGMVKALFDVSGTPSYSLRSMSKAHAESSRLEYRCRHHPDELHDSLAVEGWT